MAAEAIKTELKQVPKVTVFKRLLPREVTPEALARAQPQIEDLAKEFLRGLGGSGKEGDWVSAREMAKAEMVRKGGGREGTTEEVQSVLERVFTATGDFYLAGWASTVTRLGGGDPLEQWPLSSLIPLAKLGVCGLELSSDGKLNLEFALRGGGESSLVITPETREPVSTLNRGG